MPHAASFCLGGLLIAKSPLVTLNKIHAFFLSVTSIDALNNPVTVPILVVANSLDELRRLSLENCHLNEFILLSGLKVNRIALDEGKRWLVALFKAEKGGNIKRIDESEVYPVPPELFDCCFDKQQDFMAYEGTVTRNLEDSLVIFDGGVLIVGATGLAVCQKVKFFNLAKASADHNYAQSLASLHNIRAENIFIFLPWMSSMTIDTDERIDSNPVVYPSFCFRDHKTRLRDHLGSIGFSKDFSKVANWLWKSHSVGFMFLQTTTGNHQRSPYFDDFRISEIGRLVPEKSDDENMSSTCFYRTACIESDELLIGKLSTCPVSGLSKISDQTGSVLIQTEVVYPEGGLVCIKGFCLVSETFLIDPLVMSKASRAYLKPSAISCFSAPEDFSLSINMTYYLVTVSNVSPPSLTQIRPVKLEGSISGNCICVIKLDGNELNIKGTEKKVTLEILPEFWHKFGSSLQVGSSLITVKSPQGGFTPEFLIDLETDASLTKGAGRFLGGSRTLLVSREVHDHVQKKSAPSSTPQGIRSILSNSDDDSCFVHFQGVLISVELITTEEGRKSSVFQRLFVSHSVGLPIDGAKLRLGIADSCESTYEISVDYTPSVLPVGLVKGATVEGTNFKFDDGTLLSHSNSYLRIRSNASPPDATPIDVKTESTVPFHYLADFYGYHMKHPNTPVMIYCSVESIENLKIAARCRKCESSISQFCCPLHGRISTDEVDLDVFLNCIVHDGTFSAHATISGLQTVLNIVGFSDKLDQITNFASVAGAIDYTSPLFAKGTANLRFQRYRIKAMVTEAIQKVAKPAQFLYRKIKLGRSIHQAYSYPGKINLSVLEACVIDDKDVARRYLDLLEL